MKLRGSAFAGDAESCGSAERAKAAVRRMSSTRADQEIEDVWLGCVYAWLCTSATVEGLASGRACWAAGQIENRPTPVNGCPQDDP